MHSSMKQNIISSSRCVCLVELTVGLVGFVLVGADPAPRIRFRSTFWNGHYGHDQYLWIQIQFFGHIRIWFKNGNLFWILFWLEQTQRRGFGSAAHSETVMFSFYGSGSSFFKWKLVLDPVLDGTSAEGSVPVHIRKRSWSVFMYPDPVFFSD